MPRILSLALVASLVAAADSIRPGTVLLDGSSTVYPITVAVAEGFAAENPQVAVEVLVSGSSAGFRRLLAGEIPIADASRPINVSEMEKATKAGLEFIELPVAWDGVTVVVNRANTFVDHLTVAELQRLWRAEDPARTWRQLRAAWPDQPAVCFTPGKDSGTFDFFSEAITGKSRSQRSDATPSEDDNELVQGIAANPGSIGYFGFAYFRDNAAMLRALPIDAGKGPVTPTVATIANGSYQPLARPLFIYVNKAALSRPEVVSFIEYYLRYAQRVVPQVGYVPLGDRLSALVRSRFAARTTGTLFPSPNDTHRLAELLGDKDGGAGEVTATAKPLAAVPAIKPSPSKPDPRSAMPAAAPVLVTATKPIPAGSTAVSTSSLSVQPAKPLPSSASAPVTAGLSAAPAPAVLVPTPIRPGGDAFTLALAQMGTSSLTMARSALDASASLDDLDRASRRLIEDAQRFQMTLPDRRLVEAATATGIDRWRAAALGLVQLRAGNVDATQLGDAARGALEAAQRDQLTLIEAARTPPEIEAARNREAAFTRFEAACRRWSQEIGSTP